MSQELIARSPDLKRLRDEGHDIEIRAGHLTVAHVPYVNSQREVKYGTLVSTLKLSGDIAAPPDTHVVLFAGEYPCNRDGSQITAIQHASTSTRIDDTLTVNHSFSNRPSAGYADYYAKMTRYIEIISNPAKAIDPNVKAQIFPVIEDRDRETVFNYIDTASSRAGIHNISIKLKVRKLAIVGLGGTGSYVLDLVAKTPVGEIHLFDGDRFFNHNAFRSPGAASIEELKAKPLKVDYFAEIYSRMRRQIIPHAYFVDESNVEQLRDMDFIFLCLDSGRAKHLIVNKLEEFGKAFVDVGMGIYEADGALAGTVRLTTSTPSKREHFRKRVGLTDELLDDEYARNIQIADLNALNAALAVIKWKKLSGFYVDLEGEHHTTYTVNGNSVSNEELNESSDAARA